MKFIESMNPKKQSVLGLDTSTNSAAWSYFENGKLVDHGEVVFKGRTSWERLAHAKEILSEQIPYTPDIIIYESAVYIQNKQTVIILAYAIGAIVSSLMLKGVQVEKTIPIEWQSFIGNKALTKAEKDSIKKQYPDKTVAQLKEKHREIRKQRTIDWVENKFGVKVDNDNQSDAIAIGWFGSERYTK